MICILFIQVKLKLPEKLSGTRNTNSYTSLTEKQIVSLVSLEASK
jgi:hypothetical protein